jgi:GGDEF domain-containing protein
MIRLLAKLGRFNTVAIITVIAAAASVLVTTCAVLILNTYYGFSIRLNVALALVIGVTLVVAPLINWILVGIMLRIYRLEKELRNLASYDSLTGLLSRHAFLENANRAISLANRHQAAFAVLIIDLDHLKSINDLHGNPAGDAVLKLLADVVNSVARRSDIVGRLGGEEFAMLIGLTASSTGSLDSIENLLAHADLALYQAKSDGRNRTAVFNYATEQVVAG